MSDILSLHPDRFRAIAQARAECASDGGRVYVHAPRCATVRNQPCDCLPYVIRPNDPRTTAEIETAITRAHREH